MIVLPDHVFVQATQVGKAPPLQQVVSQEEIEPADPMYKQDEDILKPWVDAHQLKKVNKTWYKEG